MAGKKEEETKEQSLQILTYLYQQYNNANNLKIAIQDKITRIKKKMHGIY